MYVYIKSDPELWTVGFYTPKGKWVAESDHNDTEKAANRVHFLNGGEKIYNYDTGREVERQGVAG